MVFFAVIGGAALVQPAKHFRLPCQSVTAFVCDRCDFQSAETIPGSRKKLIDVSGEEAIPCKIAMPIMVALY